MGVWMAGCMGGWIHGWVGGWMDERDLSMHSYVDRLAGSARNCHIADTME